MTLINELEQLLTIAKGNTQQKHTASGVGDPFTVYGVGGLFGTPGLARDVISSRVAGIGLAAALPALPDVKQYPLYPYVTGQADNTGTQPDNECDDAPVAGNLLSCNQTAQFGIVQFRTRELQINDVGSIQNDGVTLDHRLLNDPLVEQLGSIFPTLGDPNLAFNYAREMVMRIREVGMEFQEYLSIQLYTGTGTGVEFPGLELLVTEGHYDANTGTECEGLDSIVVDFGDTDITTASGSASIVNTITQTVRELKYNSTSMRLDPTTWAIVMRPQLFTEVTDVWPCQYSQYRCQPTTANASLNVDTFNGTQMRDQMRQGSYLLIDGMQVPVIQDSWMPEDDLGDGLHSSDIYILPLTFRGGQQGIFWEYFDYNVGSIPAIRDGQFGQFWSDGGRYLWSKAEKRWCVDLQAKIKARVRLQVPQLAARIQNVGATVTRHYRDPNRDSEYYVNGGDGLRPSPSLYNQWDNIPT